MSKITVGTDIINVAEKDQIRYISSLFNQIAYVLNNGLDFQTNFRSSIQDVTFSVANADVIVNHSLGSAPLGYLAIRKSAAMSIYTGSLQPSSERLVLRSSAIGQAKILIF